MKLFQMKSNPHGTDRTLEFLKDNYVCIGWPGIGNLDKTGEEQVRERLLQAYRFNDQEALADGLAAIDLFVNTMKDGDYVLVSDGDWVHLGDLGDYFYDEAYDQAEDGRCHRRGVTWLTSMPCSGLNAEVQEFLAERQMVSQFKGKLPRARLDLWMTASPAHTHAEKKPVRVEEETIAEALDIVIKALRCEDAQRRERAAIAILQYVK